MENIIFLFSLPRSGSTLLQKMLGAHSQIATSAEPWLLLPLIYSQKAKKALAEYDHRVSVMAIEDIIDNLPQKKKDFDEAIRNFALHIYSKLCKKGEKYFLDKTPRYYLIIPEIARIFPEAKFIFIFRNPLQWLASMLKSFAEGKLLYLHRILFDIEKSYLLTQGFYLLSDKAIAINFEDILRDPSDTMRNICNYLDIPFEEKMITHWKDTELKGRIKDPIGTQKYSSISTEPLEKWKNTFDTYIKKKWAEKWLNSLSEDLFKLSKSSKKEVLQKLSNHRVTLNPFSNLSDLIESIISSIYDKLNLKFLFARYYKTVNLRELK